VKTHLSERGVAFEVKDIRANPQYVRELVGTYKSHGTPTIFVDNEIMVGFDPERLDKMLGLST